MPKSTSAKLALMCPTYKRPWALQAVVDNIEATAVNDFMIYFGCEPDDIAGIEAARATGYPVVINPGNMGYSNTIQAIYEQSKEPFLWHINDDFLFLDRFDEVPIAMFATDWVQVVGVKQNEADRSMSAICLFRRKYIEEQSGVIDMPNRVFYPYNHNYIDTEFTQTAQHRNAWAACDSPCINHLHPGFTGADKDETYKKNDATYKADEATFNSRKHLWS